jgi:hypothetical protein
MVPLFALTPELAPPDVVVPVLIVARNVPLFTPSSLRSKKRLLLRSLVFSILIAVVNVSSEVAPVFLSASITVATIVSPDKYAVFLLRLSPPAGVGVGAGVGDDVGVGAVVGEVVTVGVGLVAGVGVGVLTATETVVKLQL